MVCIECDQEIVKCECADIEERLRTVIKTGNAFARREAKRVLLERIIARPQPNDTSKWSDEHWEAFDLALKRAWADHCARNN